MQNKIVTGNATLSY